MSRKSIPERFRALPNFPGYEISDHGNLWSYWARDGSDRLLGFDHHVEGTVFNDGRYIKFALKVSPKVYIQRTAHSLVAELFIGPCPLGMHVCHIDGNGLNNHVSNLRYDTPRGNAADRKKHGTSNSGARNGMAKLTADDVRAIRARLDAGELQRVVAKDYGLSAAYMSSLMNRTVWTHLP